MERTSNYDNTKQVKEIRNMIIEQISNHIADYFCHVDISLNGYRIVQDLTFDIKNVMHHSIDGPYWKEKFILLGIENRQETYNGKEIHTTLFGADIAKEMNNAN